ncbi:acetylglutamate kinase [Ructibacterium gallinarum]|uniref:Acetylglutamate kinase n=1 Tax=Ructibacterium gallinarum TaxID=2779355 RepID=A0A9D5LZB8_9FIRM|nr:acetylglutamate kinase [Ructibacterium gallinarum]MBE5040831.1 acetylglutamate kinase [Ructibacterium gallinarum]
MEFSMEQLIGKASILIEALPYIQKFNGKTVVIKYGGNAMINEDLKNRVMEDITLLKYIGINPVVVHGGGPDISAALTRFGIQSEFINGLRVTDAQTMQVAQMVLIGKTNKEIVSLLGTKGGNGLGVSGIDGNLIQCRKCYTQVNGKDTDIGFVGEIVNINEKVLADLTQRGYIPVVAPIGVDENGNSYNINADTVAGAIAEALEAEKLMLLTDTEGIKESADSTEVFSVLSRKQIYTMIDEGKIVGGMIPKVEGAIRAIEAGVNSVHIVDGRIPHCLLLEIFTDHGIGTMITR